MQQMTSFVGVRLSRVCQTDLNSEQIRGIKALTTVSPRWKWASCMLLIYSCPRDWIKNSHLRNTNMSFYNPPKARNAYTQKPKTWHLVFYIQGNLPIQLICLDLFRFVRFFSRCTFCFVCLWMCQIKVLESCPALWQVLSLPWKPLGVLLPGVVPRLPVPQPPVAVEALDIVTVTCWDVQRRQWGESNEGKTQKSAHIYSLILNICLHNSSYIFFKNKVKLYKKSKLTHKLKPVKMGWNNPFFWHGLDKTHLIVLHLIALVFHIVPTAHVLPEAV